jgi:release factor glutamine methyltransferase
MKQSPLYQELHAQLTAGLAILPDKPEETVDNTLHAIWLRAKGHKFSARLAGKEPLAALEPAEQQRAREWVRQRIAGMPLSHITERQHFMGLDLLAGPQALVPRVETELLAGVAIELANLARSPSQPLRVIDVCTGSGNVALAIAHHVPTAHLYAADLSAEAVALARQNAEHLGLSNRAQFRSGDLLAPFDSEDFIGKTDLLTCNPPYISSAKVKQMAGEIAGHEPALAFDGGPFGVSILVRLTQEAPRFLKPGCWLAFEVGLGQGPVMVKRLAGSPLFDLVRPHQDAHGDVRAISARRAAIQETA